MDRERAEPRVESPFPGERAERWVEYHDTNAATSTAAYGFVWDTTAEATGPFCTDADGNVLLDFTSHVASTPLGYNNPRLREKLKEFGFTSPTKIAGHSFYACAGSGSDAAPQDAGIPGPSHLMDRLTDLTADYGLDTVFLSNTGAEAVENGIKICYDHTEGAKQGFTFQGAFHGRTLGALSLNRSKAAHRRHYPEIAGVLDFPYCDDRTCAPETCSCGFFPSDDSGVSQLREALGPNGYTDPDDVAYIVVESVQGEGGYRFPSDAFADEVQAVCDEYDILLVADEVQTGLGRTGEWWGCDNYAFEPDVITSAKALQVGATVSRREVFPDEKSRISSTWGAGDLVAALQGATIIDVIEEENLLRNARERGEQLKKRVREEDPDCVTDVRGKGLMVAVELDSKERLEATVRAALERGLLTLGCGVSTLRLLPPLDVREREIEVGARLLLDAVEQASEEGADCAPTDPT